MHNNLLLANPAGDDKLYVEDVFSTYLYTGTGTKQTITTGIDIPGKGGLLWVKNRTGTQPVGGYEHLLFDTSRPETILRSNTSGAAENGFTSDYFNFTSTGFNTGNGVGTGYQNYLNKSGNTYASWTFRKAPKFFDVVTFTTSSGATVINHALGSTPGMVIIKRVDATSNWLVWHRSLAAQNYLLFSSTAASADLGAVWCTPTSTSVTIENTFSAAGQSWVAYLFAHDTTADGIVQCGTVTGGAAVNLGWEPQFVLWRDPTQAYDWRIIDNMRGGSMADGIENTLFANTSGAESGYGNFKITATGFTPNSTGTFIYLAIRRGPMRTPTDATKVFAPVARTGTGNEVVVSGNLITDLALIANRQYSDPKTLVFDRFRSNLHLLTSSTAAEVNGGTSIIAANPFDNMLGIKVGTISGQTNAASNNFINYLFRRAPGFFDVVSYTGTGSARTVSHNLGVAPELIILKGRSSGTQWTVSSTLFADVTSTYIFLNLTDGIVTGLTNLFQTPTASTIGIGTGYAANSNWNSSGATYVAYLFASCPGVSKVGTFTGNGSSQNINCGFTNGARFVLIKRTDSTGDWYVWDTARGIISANDPHLSLNSTAAEVTTNDSIDPLSVGFTVVQNATTNVNVDAATYLYLAIA